jgi:hypothetical protein
MMMKLFYLGLGALLGLGGMLLLFNGLLAAGVSDDILLLAPVLVVLVLVSSAVGLIVGGLIGSDEEA